MGNYRNFAQNAKSVTPFFFPFFLKGFEFTIFSLKQIIFHVLTLLYFVEDFLFSSVGLYLGNDFEIFLSVEICGYKIYTRERVQVGK